MDHPGELAGALALPARRAQELPGRIEDPELVRGAVGDHDPAARPARAGGLVDLPPGVRVGGADRDDRTGPDRPLRRPGRGSTSVTGAGGEQRDDYRYPGAAMPHGAPPPGALCEAGRTRG